MILVNIIRIGAFAILFILVGFNTNPDPDIETVHITVRLGFMAVALLSLADLLDK